jgi:hypothetical protein
MNRFIKNRSCINDISNDIKPIILEIAEDCDHYISIMLLTILNNQGQKHNVSLHGYYMASGIEMLMIITKILDNEAHYIKKYSKTTIDKIVHSLYSYINICLSYNIESIQTGVTKDVAIKIYHICAKILNNKTSLFLLNDKIESNDTIKRTDVMKYKFPDPIETKTKLLNLKQIKKDKILEYVQKRYGTVCQLSLLNGWLLGSGDEKMVASLERLGSHLGIMIKLAYDFNNIENDLKNAEGVSHNVVINCGIQESFELFFDSKQKFIEGSLILDIYTNTSKEIIDLIELQIDNVLDKTSLDLKSNYTLTSNTID